MEETKKTQKVVSYPLKYQGSIIILVVLSLLWLPLGAVLFMKNGAFIKGKAMFSFNYHGSYFWLIFWTIVFFPIAIVLLALNGADIVESSC